jgi:frataxin-like iron-binding protein CyaY
MTEERFDEVVDEVCKQITDTLKVKAKEYHFLL